jgi:ABC-2 type transport system permease protein
VPRKRRALIVAAVMFALFHLIGLPMALRIAQGGAASVATARLFASGMLLVLLSGMVSAGLVATIQAIYMRGDLDLLISSPVSARAVMAARSAAIALTIAVGSGILALPFADMLGAFADRHWLAAYLWLPFLAMLATSVSLVVALLLIRLLGVRRTRIAAQILAGLIGLGVAVFVQLPNLMLRANNAQLSVWADEAAKIAPDNPVWLPARAVLGEPLPLAFACLLAALAFAAAVNLLAPRFIGSVIAAGAMEAPPRRAERESVRAFGRSFRAGFRRKELLLLFRDPWLISQIAQQIGYLALVGLVLWYTADPGNKLGWLAVIVIAGNLGGALAWITMSAEDAPDLLAAAPVTRSEIRNAKLEAALLPVGALLLPPILFAFQADLSLGLVLTACSTASAVSCALLNLAVPSPGRRRQFNRRRQENTLLAFAETFLAISWAAAGYGLLRFLTP